MGLTKEFFTLPIEITCTLQQGEGQHKAVFKLRREKGAESDAIVREKLLAGDFSSSSLSLSRFCNLLTEAPKGFDDFPKKGDLRERALKYFDGDEFSPLIDWVMLEYDRAQRPVEFFRGI